MDSASLLRDVRLRAGLSQRQLAGLAQTSASAVCLYESGERVPRVDTLARLLSAMGKVLVLDAVDAPQIDAKRNARILVEVLELAKHLPFKASRTLEAPVFADLAQ